MCWKAGRIVRNTYTPRDNTSRKDVKLKIARLRLKRKRRRPRMKKKMAECR